MKKTSSIIQWILTGFLGLCALVNGFHWSSLLFILAGVLFMPLPAIYEAFKKIKLKKGFVIALAAIVMLVGMFNSPLGELNRTQIQVLHHPIHTRVHAQQPQTLRVQNQEQPIQQAAPLLMHLSKIK